MVLTKTGKKGHSHRVIKFYDEASFQTVQQMAHDRGSTLTRELNLAVELMATKGRLHSEDLKFNNEGGVI